MDNEYSADLISLLDEDGVEHEFEILDVINNDDGCFYALLPIEGEGTTMYEEMSGCYFIFEAIEDEDKQQMLVEVEDEELLEKLSEQFEARFDEMYEEDYSENE